MILAHGNTPFHDDPFVLSWVQVAGGLGVVGSGSFALYALRDRIRAAIHRWRYHR